MNFVDKTLTCRECEQPFTFTAGEQEFYQQKGLVNQPARCPECRARRRSSGGADARHGGRSGSESRAPRVMYTVTCDACGAETQVPFEPKQDKPVYCSPCYDKVRVARG
ncbi:MAG: zinc-ribbon domain containing protein [Ktedonobacteraceae bacterium]|nr:zinc-ribbon domain containing protein [Ktedonobacteraceae bacterium]MBV9691287.1 zinc-ribbon domain containing protein [Ktedonobacteraceae bacterium]